MEPSNCQQAASAFTCLGRSLRHSPENPPGSRESFVTAAAEPGGSHREEKQQNQRLFPAEIPSSHPRGSIPAPGIPPAAAATPWAPVPGALPAPAPTLELLENPSGISQLSSVYFSRSREGMLEVLVAHRETRIHLQGNPGAASHRQGNPKAEPGGLVVRMS